MPPAEPRVRSLVSEALSESQWTAFADVVRYVQRHRDATEDEVKAELVKRLLKRTVHVQQDTVTTSRLVDGQRVRTTESTMMWKASARAAA